jgi:hypothetical protein
MVESFNKRLDEARGKTQGGVQIARGGGGIEQGATVLRAGGGGGTVRDVSSVLRGGRDTEAVNWDDINKALDVNTSRSRSNNEIKAEQARKILAITDATTRDKAAQAAFNVTFAQGEALMRRWAGLPPKALSDLEKFNEAVEKLHKQWEDFAEDLVNKYLPSITRALAAMAGSGWETEINRGIQSTIDEFQHLMRVGETVAAWWQGLDQNLKDAHDALWGGLQPRGPGGVPLDPSIPAMPTEQASGGYIRGPGSGTSDSIPARLSNGEYVINAASTRRLGLGLLNRLNSYSMGGLVMPPIGAPPISFAKGGLAGGSSSATTPVHLHIGGGTYPMSASSGVAAALVGAAKHSQMISSGIKPSWYGR